MINEHMAYGLLRRMTETAWEQGNMEEALRWSRWVDAAMMETLQPHEGQQPGLNAASPAGRAGRIQLRDIMADAAIPAVQP
ncbi:MAG: hypothetical protein ACI4MJ_09215 [Aristaeellaceae bacterium]